VDRGASSEGFRDSAHAQGRGAYGNDQDTVRDSGVTEVNGTPVWTAHPETGVAEAIAALLVEFYKKVDKRRRHLPDGQRAVPHEDERS
jgi:hypothetical protein